MYDNDVNGTVKPTSTMTHEAQNDDVMQVKLLCKHMLCRIMVMASELITVLKHKYP